MVPICTPSINELGFAASRVPAGTAAAARASFPKSRLFKSMEFSFFRPAPASHLPDNRVTLLYQTPGARHPHRGVSDSSFTRIVYTRSVCGTVTGWRSLSHDLGNCVDL